MKRLIELGFLACVAASAVANPVTHQKLSVIEKAARLSPGQFVWEPKAASTGPVFLVIDLTRQRVLLYRGGVLAAASTISSGSEGRETPTGVFTILQKNREHYSNLYNNAPMPFMQRLTWDGVALHAGKIPGYPASHGCVRLPYAFSELLFGATTMGVTVVINNSGASPTVVAGSLSNTTLAGRKSGWASRSLACRSASESRGAPSAGRVTRRASRSDQSAISCSKASTGPVKHMMPMNRPAMRPAARWDQKRIWRNSFMRRERSEGRRAHDRFQAAFRRRDHP